MRTSAETSPCQQLRDEYDAILLTGGATQPRDLPIPGRNLPGVHFAMEFLPQQNQRNQGDTIPADVAITATGKDVIIIGGGDTGSDCTGTSNRQGARSVTQFELLAKPPDLGAFPPPRRSPGPIALALLDDDAPHQLVARRGLRSSLERSDQGVPRDAKGNVESLVTVMIEWYHDANGRQTFREVEGTEKVWPCQLVLLAMGFLGPEKRGAIQELGLELDQRSNVKCDANYMSSVEGVFAAGDLRRGQSLVVWAIHEGREAARSIDRFLMGVTHLPSVNAADFASK